MHLSLIGMSGSGKSYWGARLCREKGFSLLSCDERIEEILSEEILSADLITSTNRLTVRLAAWLGFPYDGGYSERQKLYLSAEQRAVGEFLSALPKMPDEQVVIDTTGSFIYLNDTLCDDLQLRTIVVFLDTPESEIEKMLQVFLESPKPILWTGSYQAHPGENPAEALRRCYPALLTSRLKLYRRLAQVTIPFAVHKSPNFTCEDLLRYIEEHSR